MANIGKEFDFPTIRKGSYFLFLALFILLMRVIWKGPDRELTDMVSAVLTAIGATHAILAVGGSFLNSKFSAGAAAVEETVTTTRTVAPKATVVPDMTVQADNVTVNQ